MSEGPGAWRLDAAGWLQGCRHLPSPNFDARPEGEGVVLIVIHNISLPPDEFGGPGIDQLFTNTLDPGEHPYYETIHQLRVSSHFLIRRDGALTQYVSTLDRAWHAGVSRWRGRERCNDFSIGIELEGCDTQAFERLQYDSLVSLVGLLAEHHPIEGIAGHSDIAPGRKTDPGPCFDWDLFYRLTGRLPAC